MHKTITKDYSFLIEFAKIDEDISVIIYWRCIFILDQVPTSHHDVVDIDIDICTPH